MKKIIKVLFFLLLTAIALPRMHAQISVGVGISIRLAPPALPIYVQPACPTEGYLWTPGYWAYGQGGYFWVPGVWVMPPQVGYLWTPTYWGFENGLYGYHAGYWGAHIGFYGGINYGFGYGGVGYGGGMWEGGRFRYNTAVTNVNTTIIHNTYINRTVINNTTINNRTSFNGQGGVQAKPRPEEITAMREQHVQPTSEQSMHQQTAGKDRNQYASVNHGKPATVAMDKPNGQHFTPQGHVVTPNTAARLNTTNKKTVTHTAPVNKPAANVTKKNVSKSNPVNNKATTPRKQPATQHVAPKVQPKSQPQTQRTTQPRTQKPAPQKAPAPTPAPKQPEKTPPPVKK